MSKFILDNQPPPVKSSKKCLQCGVEKPLDAFIEQWNGKYGRTARCKACHSVNSSVRYRKLHPRESVALNVRRELLSRGLIKCRRCGETKEIVAFRKIRTPSGYKEGTMCRPCETARNKEWEETHKQQRKIYHSRYSRDPENVDRRKKTVRARRMRSPRRVMQPILIHAVTRKPAANPATIDDLMAMWDANGGRCALSGIPMTWGQGRILATSISIDRIDPDIGYSKDNVRLVCHAINSFRGRMTDAEMLAMAKILVKNMRPKKQPKESRQKPLFPD